MNHVQRQQHAINEQVFFWWFFQEQQVLGPVICIQSVPMSSTQPVAYDQLLYTTALVMQKGLHRAGATL